VVACGLKEGAPLPQPLFDVVGAAVGVHVVLVTHLGLLLVRLVVLLGHMLCCERFIAKKIHVQKLFFSAKKSHVQKLFFSTKKSQAQKLFFFLRKKTWL
jgi:hypothetical protein